MNTEMENPLERLDPLVFGEIASAPLADATRRVMHEQQTACAARETADQMAERARLMFMTFSNGPHSSGMLSGRVYATNGLLELVSKAAHAIWTSHRSEIRATCPELWDEELVRGWLLMDSMGRWLATGAAARTVGKRAAAQVITASRRAQSEGKKARGRAPRPEDRDAAAEAARKEVWAEAYISLMANVPAKQIVVRPPRPSGAAAATTPATAAAAEPTTAVTTATSLADPALASTPVTPAVLPTTVTSTSITSTTVAAAVAPTAVTSTAIASTAVTTPATCPLVGEARPATADLAQEDCRLLRFEASASPEPPCCQAAFWRAARRFGVGPAPACTLCPLHEESNKRRCETYGRMLAEGHARQVELKAQLSRSHEELHLLRVELREAERLRALVAQTLRLCAEQPASLKRKLAGVDDSHDELMALLFSVV